MTNKAILKHFQALKNETKLLNDYNQLERLDTLIHYAKGNDIENYTDFMNRMILAIEAGQEVRIITRGRNLIFRLSEKIN